MFHVCCLLVCVFFFWCLRVRWFACFACFVVCEFLRVMCLSAVCCLLLVLFSFCLAVFELFFVCCVCLLCATRLLYVCCVLFVLYFLCVVLLCIVSV